MVLCKKKKPAATLLILPKCSGQVFFFRCSVVTEQGALKRTSGAVDEKSNSRTSGDCNAVSGFKKIATFATKKGNNGSPPLHKFKKKSIWEITLPFGKTNSAPEQNSLESDHTETWLNTQFILCWITKTKAKAVGS